MVGAIKQKLLGNRHINKKLYDEFFVWYIVNTIIAVTMIPLVLAVKSSEFEEALSWVILAFKFLLFLILLLVLMSMHQANQFVERLKNNPSDSFQLEKNNKPPELLNMKSNCKKLLSMLVVAGVLSRFF